MVKKASQMFKSGDFNTCSQEVDSKTGVRTVTILKVGWKRSYKFKVKDLYGPNEEILEDEEVKK